MSMNSNLLHKPNIVLFLPIISRHIASVTMQIPSTIFRVCPTVQPPLTCNFFVKYPPAMIPGIVKSHGTTLNTKIRIMKIEDLKYADIEQLGMCWI